MDDYNAGFQNGAKHGFNRALYAVRVVDKQIEFNPKTHNKQQEAIYKAKKDILYKIYEEISLEKAKQERADENTKSEKYHVTDDGSVERL